MGQMALGTCCANTMIIVAAMDVIIMRTLKQFHAVAAYTKFRVGGGSYPLISDEPTNKRQDHKGENATYNQEKNNLSLS